MGNRKNATACRENQLWYLARDTSSRHFIRIRELRVLQDFSRLTSADKPVANQSNNNKNSAERQTHKIQWSNFYEIYFT